VRRFFREGGHGLNVTVPFKREAWDLVDRCEGGALAAEAVNTIKREGGELLGYNTDGSGLITDLQHNLGIAVAGRRVLLMGAGGASHGVLQPLLECRPALLVVANRTPERAESLVRHFHPFAALAAQGLRTQIGYLVIGSAGTLLLAVGLGAIGLLVALFGGDSEAMRSIRWTESRRAVVIMVACVVLTFALERIGYRLSVFAFLVFFLGVVERKKPVPMLLVSAGFSIVSFHVVAVMLGVPLPPVPGPSRALMSLFGASCDRL